MDVIGVILTLRPKQEGLDDTQKPMLRGCIRLLVGIPSFSGITFL